MTPRAFKQIVADGMDAPFAKMGFTPYFECSGRFYLAEYRSSRHVVSLSFEPGDGHFDIRVFSVTHGLRSDPDDPERTPTLADLNARYRGALAAAQHEAEVHRDRPPDERQLLRVMRELRMVMPLYLAESVQNL
jgi:hypothetical protein